MGKTDFTKVDEVLNAALQRYSIDEMLEYSDIVKEAKGVSARLMTAQQQLDRKKKRRLLIAKLRFDIDRFFKVDRHLYTALGTYHDEVEDLFKRCDELDNQDVLKLRAIAQALEEYRKKKEAEKPPVDDQQLVQESRKDSINQRFNVRKGWLPLH